MITPEYQRRMFADYYNWAAENLRFGRGAQVPRDPAIHGHSGLRAGPRGPACALSLAHGHGAGRMVQPESAHRTDRWTISSRSSSISWRRTAACCWTSVPTADGTIPVRPGRCSWPWATGSQSTARRSTARGRGSTLWRGADQRGNGGGFSENADKPFGPEDIRFTTKGDALYAIALGWPKDGKLLIRSLAADAGKVTAVSLLGHAGTLAWEQGDQGLQVTLPAENRVSTPLRPKSSVRGSSRRRPHRSIRR